MVGLTACQTDFESIIFVLLPLFLKVPELSIAEPLGGSVVQSELLSLLIAYSVFLCGVHYHLLISFAVSKIPLLSPLPFFVVPVFKCCSPPLFKELGFSRISEGTRNDVVYFLAGVCVVFCFVVFAWGWLVIKGAGKLKCR